MLAATVKIGAKNFIQVEVLQAIKSKLDHLPEKQKTMLNFRDAAMFLYPCIKAAIQKNYTKDEILQIIVKEGWSITQNSFRYLWSFFLSEEENSGRKKSNSKSAAREKHIVRKSNIRNSQDNINVDLSHDDSEMNEHTSASEISNPDVPGVINETDKIQYSADKDSQSEISEKNSMQSQSAHFDLPPDSEDL